MDGTILGQGTFTALGSNASNNTTAAASPIAIAIPSGVDWIRVRNYTKYGAAGNTAATIFGTTGPIGIDFYWQRGMGVGTGIVSYKTNSSAALNADTFTPLSSTANSGGGFTLYDPSGQTPGALPLYGAPIAVTAVTNATRPVVSTANTTGIVVGSIVRLTSTAQNDVNGIDMVVGAVTAGVSFTLLTTTNALATAPGAIGGAGFYRQVNYFPLFYPRRHYVTNITQASVPTVSTAIPHGYVAGNLIRFAIPTVSGMVQLNGVAATVVTVVDDYSFTINVDTTSFTAFTWPTIAQEASSFPIVVPVGEDTASAILSLNAQTPSIGGQQIFNTNTGILSDSTVNIGFLGMILGTGGNGLALTTPIIGPAGTITNASNVQTADTMYWLAGKSTFGGL